MLPDIRTKLSDAIKDDNRSEMQAVYILSRIRKIIELKKSKDIYPILKFYCDCALHSRIDNTGGTSVNTMLVKAINGNPIDLLTYQHLYHEMNNFLQKEDLPIFNATNWKSFTHYLGKVISDTPIYVSDGKNQYEVKYLEPLNEDSSMFTVAPLN